MKILITGGLGHIGSKLIRELPFSFPGSEIVIVDNMMTQRYCSLFNLPLEGRYKFVEADITKIDFIPLLRNVDVVVHLAAITDAAGSFGNAEEVENNNFNATKQVAEACASAGVRMIALSSTSVYGTTANKVDEDCLETELMPHSPYAVTKLKEERLVQKLVRENGLKAVIFRFGTIFGTSPGMRFHTAVNKFVWQATTGQPITVWSSALNQKRPYLDLSDAIKALIFIIINNQFTGNVYNAVTTNLTVEQVIQKIQIHIPEVNVKFVNSPIMNQLSYEVINKNLNNANFQMSGDVEKAIQETVELIKCVNHKNKGY